MRALLLTLTTCVFIVPVQAQYSGGTGDPNDPYQIATAADLIALGETPEDYDKCFVLTADIDLDPNLPGGRVFDRAVIAPDVNDADDWFEGASFTGFFDGAGHTISHLTIAGGDFLGLFGQVVGYWRPPLGTVVKNLAVADVRISGTGDYVGGLVGHNYGGTVTQCYSSGLVSGSSYVGGLVGMESIPSRGGARTIMDCYSTAAVSATTAYAGGVVGYNDGRIIRCYSAGPVSAPVGAGGLAGGDEYYGSVTDCFWDIETSGQTTRFGGMGKTTQEMYAASTFVPWGACVSVWTIDEGRDYPRLAWENAPGQIIAGPAYAGGTGTPEDPYIIATTEDLETLGLCSCHWDKHFTLVADIDLSGRTWTGSVIPSFSGVFDGDTHVISGLTINGEGVLGLFGVLASGACVTDLGVVDVNIVGSGTDIGGLAGWNDGSVTHCYSTGVVSGNRNVGGLIGNNRVIVTHCYSLCRVSGDQYVGGLAGYNSGDIARCYSAGPVSGNTLMGGLIGEGSPVGALDCVWDVETSGLSASAGGVGLTTGEIMDPSMLGLNGFAEDPNWVLDAGRDYPRLAWQVAAGTIIPEPIVDWLEGQGTAEEPYRIDSADRLILLGRASALWDRHFVLGADIDLDPNLPEGAVFGQAVVQVFSGVFDGDGHAISHLTIQGGSYLGLFGWVADPNSEIRNVRLIDPNVYGQDHVGAVAGQIGEGSVTNCTIANGLVCGENNVGGLAGAHQSGTITDCSVLGGRVSGNSTVGGLAGSGDRIIRCCLQQVEVVSAGEFFGSVGGLAASAKEIVDSQVTGGLVRGLSEVGGLVARMTGGTISGCCTSTRVEAADQGFSLWLTIGGLVGDNGGTIENSYSTSGVTQANAGNLLLLGLGPSGAGGLVGSNRGTIRLSYSTGAVVTAPSVGTFGWTLEAGGLAGSSWGSAESSFWDTETSGQTTSAGGTGLTTAEMQTAAIFLEAGWDFVDETENGTEDIWWILEGQDYPRLWWERGDEAPLEIK
ncbi:MAG: hypothetical protein JW741_09825 [Sedimentisphaerales bacterium]|nr:hypothetical protein [Sedimentisphaerales bacterium]